MIAKSLLRAIWAGVAIVALLITPPVFAQNEADTPSVELSDEISEAVDTAVQSAEQAQTEESREQIIQEAMSALRETRNALSALDDERPDDALSSLAIATGQLELLLAREPELALAPTGVSVMTRDVYGSRAAIEEAIDDAEDFLEDGEVQSARRLLDGLASEIVVTVTNIPLATYPDAIKAIAPLIDDGKLDEAKRGLQAALNTLVLTDHVIPLPAIRAQAMLEQAEAFAEDADRSVEDSEQLAELLARAREELEMAELLGYGRASDYEDLYAQIGEIETKTQDGQSGQGLFSNLRDSMSKLWR